jgi:secernin
MCDTVVATGAATASGRVIFAKNSDREPDEAQAVELHPASVAPPGSRTRCTYVDLPAASRTHAVLLCRPHWMWGAEMGANEQGVAVGNEAVFTRAPREPLALLGMDLVRLVLERADSAEHGVEVLGSLLEEHGQGGPAGYRDKGFVYDSSFIIADPGDAWVFETANRAWAAKRVTGVRSISNGLTLRDDWDRAASGLAARARDWKLAAGKGRIDFARTFSDPWLTRAAAAEQRRACTESFLARRAGSIGPLDAMAALRQHGARPGTGVFFSVCAHASWWPTRRAAQTTGSLVSELDPSRALHWFTATAAPCTSLFKPAWLDAGLPELGPTPREHYAPDSLWWRHERVHRRALQDLSGFLRLRAAERDRLEADLVARAGALARAPTSQRRGLSELALANAEELEQRWLSQIAPSSLAGPMHRRFWQRIDRRARIDP